MEVEGNRVVVYRENAKDSKKLLSSLKNKVGFMALYVSACTPIKHNHL